MQTGPGELELTDGDVLDPQQDRDALLRGIGLNPAITKWPEPVGRPHVVAEAVDEKSGSLSDHEWTLIQPLLPAEPAQAGAMSNRDFIDGVVTVMRRGGAWTDYPKKAPHSDRVRRRFGRWAERGIWRMLAHEVARLSVSAARRVDFANAARRAAELGRR